MIYVSTFKDAQVLCFKRTLESGDISNSFGLNFNVDIKTHVVASALNRISVTLNLLQTIVWYNSEARFMAHRIAFSDFQ